MLPRCLFGKIAVHLGNFCGSKAVKTSEKSIKFQKGQAYSYIVSANCESLILNNLNLLPSKYDAL